MPLNLLDVTFGPISNGREGLDQRPTELREQETARWEEPSESVSGAPGHRVQGPGGSDSGLCAKFPRFLGGAHRSDGCVTQKANNQSRPLVRNPVQRLSRRALLGVDGVLALAHADMTLPTERPFQGTPKGRSPICLVEVTWR